MFPKIFDLYNFCTPALKSQLDVGREVEAKQREEEDRIRLEGIKKLAEESDKMVSGEVQA